MSDASRHPDLSVLFCEGLDYLLLFAPVDLALEISATRESLAGAETWGAVKRELSPDRLTELVDRVVGGSEPPDDDEPFEATEPWPALQYSGMSDWLPDSVLNQFGQRFDGLFDSGINFESEDQESIVEALGDAGVSVRFDGPSLADLFNEET